MKFGIQDALTLIATNKKNENPLLDLSNLGLREIPNAIFELHHLEELVLGVDYESEDGMRVNRNYFDTNGRNHIEQGQVFIQNEIKVIPNEISQLQQLKKLHLSSNKIADFSPLQTLPSLTVLDIGHQGFPDLKTLNGLTNLKKLDARNCQVEQLANLPQLPNLRCLNLSGNQLSTLAGLENFPALQELQISENKFRALSVLGIHSLKKLYATKNSIEKIEGIHHLTKLEILDLSYNNITNLDSLNNLPSLKTLILYSNRIREIDALSDLPQLEILKASKNKVTLKQGLPFLPNLIELTLINNQIKTLPNFEPLPKLKKLNLSSNQLISIDKLDPLTHLEQLRLNGNFIKEINGLSKLSTLTHLNLSGNIIETVNGLPQLPRLMMLDLSKNQIIDIKQLPTLPALEKLFLGYNLISKVDNLPSYPNLARFNIAHNQLKTLDGINRFLSLERLNASNNLIEGIKALAPLQKLTRLDLKQNQIIDITVLGKLKALIELNLDRNKIATVNLLNALSNLIRLKINHNPVEKTITSLHLPQLEHLGIGNIELKNLSFLTKFTNLKDLFISVKEKEVHFPNLPNLEQLSIHSIKNDAAIFIEQGVNVKKINVSLHTNSQLLKISNLPNLDDLTFSASPKTTIELENLPKVAVLSIDSQFKDISFQGLPNLVILKGSISKESNKSFLNQLPQLLSLDLRLEYTSIDPKYIENLKELRYLKLDGVTDLALENLSQQLEYLTLVSGQIENIQPLETLNYLKTLNLNCNKIKDFGVLENLDELSTLFIHDNPVEQFPEWKNLPKLSTFIGGNSYTHNRTTTLPALPNFSSSSFSITNFTLRTPIEQPPLQLSNLSIGIKSSSDLEILKNCTTLEQIYINAYAPIDTLVISSFVALERFRFSRNAAIRHLIIRDNPTLKRVNIRGANISEVSVFNNPNLITLEIDRSQLKKVNQLSGLPNLSSLKLGFNRLSSFPIGVELPSLTDLNLAGNQLSEVGFVKAFPKLHNLSFRDNRVIDIQALKFLPYLTWLDLGNNNVENISVLKHLRFLDTLSLDENKIISIEGIEKLSRLENLWLDKNKIINIQPLTNFKKLRTLRLNQNQISDILPLKNLIRLIRIDLSNNQISNVQALSNLDYLTRISLRDNVLTKFPSYLLKKDNLRSLDVVNNPIIDIPYEISNRRNSLIDAKNWFNDLVISHIENYELKLIIVGNGRIGKTCIVNRLLFNTYRDDESSTHAIQLHRWQKKVGSEKDASKTLYVNIWDFGGQDIYHATHRLFMQSRALYLIVWDALMEKQLESEEIQNGQKFTYRNFGLPYWVEYIRSYSKKSPALIVQNKIDRDTSLSPPQKAQLEDIYPIESYIGVSAKKGTNIEQLDQLIFDTVWAKMPEIGLRMPLSWHQVKQVLLEKAENIISISYDEFEAICLQAKVEERSVNSLLTYLHNCGIVFYQAQLFGNKIILDQRWAIEAVYALFDRRGAFYQSKKGVGTFNVTELTNAFPPNKYSSAEQKVILTFMESCQICFKNIRKDQQTVFIVPELLPEKPSSKVQQMLDTQDTNGIHLIYQHPILHRSFVQRFIIKAGHLAKASQMWRDGIFFKYQGSWALVKAEFKDYSGTIHIQTHGTRKEYLMYLIQRAFRNIYNYKDVELTQLVSADGKSFVLLENLKKVGKVVNNTHIIAEDGIAIDLNQLSYFTKSAATIEMDLAKTIQELGRYRINKK